MSRLVRVTLGECMSAASADYVKDTDGVWRSPKEVAAARFVLVPWRVGETVCPACGGRAADHWGYIAFHRLRTGEGCEGSGEKIGGNNDGKVAGRSAG